MKKFFKNLWGKIKNLWLWIWKQLKNKTNVVIFILCFIVLSCEVWVPYLLFFITKNGWWLGIGSACWAFWLAPFTPFLPLCIGLTIFVRKLYDKIRNRKEKKMKLKPKSTVHNPRALVYRRFIGLEKSINLATVYFTLTDSKYWTFDNETLEFSQIDASLIPAESVVTKITDNYTFLNYQGHWFTYTGTQWIETNYFSEILLSATFNNIAKYQTNKYYYVGSFDYMIKGSVDGATTQYIKGNIIPLTSLNIKYFDDSINLAVDDLVVIDKKLYAVENPETVKKMQPKAFNIYFATLNSIL